jgi:hypothetical protein
MNLSNLSWHVSPQTKTKSADHYAGQWRFHQSRHPHSGTEAAALTILLHQVQPVFSKTDSSISTSIKIQDKT